MEGSGQLHAPDALTPGKEPQIRIGYEVWWTPETVWKLWSREKSLGLSKDRTQTVQTVDRRDTDWTIAALYTYDCKYKKYVHI
jgi:hypothetical protein